MTGRQKIESAFSEAGTDEIPAVICYEGIYIRDHWKQITSHPWWYQHAPDLERQMMWYRDFINRTGQDWFALPSFYSGNGRIYLKIVEDQDGVFLVNKLNGQYRKLTEPKVGGWSESDGLHSYHPDRLAETTDEIDSLIYISPEFSPNDITEDGRSDLASEFLMEFGGELYPICHVSSPLWCTYQLWGFEGMMTMIASRPDLVRHACQRFFTLNVRKVQQSACFGAEGIWIEECMTDMISPEAFQSLNVPFMQELVDEIRKVGLKSIYYFCGNPAGKWESIMSIGADAISLEESKKGFIINIDEVVDRVQGRFTVLGNLDAISLLQSGAEEQLRAEIKRQINAGRRNGGRFIMSLGSPVTPGTPVERVRLYCDLVHELGNL